MTTHVIFPSTIRTSASKDASSLTTRPPRISSFRSWPELTSPSACHGTRHDNIMIVVTYNVRNKKIKYVKYAHSSSKINRPATYSFRIVTSCCECSTKCILSPRTTIRAFNVFNFQFDAYKIKITQDYIPRSILVTSSRWCHEDATRNIVLCNFYLIRVELKIKYVKCAYSRPRR